MNDKTTRQVTLLGFIAAMVCYGLIWITGCTSPGSHQSEWHPKTKKEMKMLVGQATLSAIEQYMWKRIHRKPVSTKPKKGPLLHPDQLIEPDQRS